MNRLYWRSDKALPEWVRKGLNEKTSLLIGIKEWMEGQDHRQLSEFISNAGFNFRLRTDGHPEIIITKKNYKGSCSMGNGEFQAFYVQLDEDQLKALVPGVPYTLHPENKSDKYVWMVDDGVTLVRPIPYHDIVLTKLDNILLPSVEIDTDIQGAIAMLNEIKSSVDYAGTAKKIHFHLQAKPEEISKAANIRFSAKGLSVMEVLWIICHRASLDYRIEETTVYIENRR